MKVDKITPAILNNWLLEARIKGDTLNCRTVGGFHVRINQSSEAGEKPSASFRVKIRVKGKARVPTIGKTIELSVDQARKLALHHKSNANVGIDILDERRQAKAQRRPTILKLPTLQQWFDSKHHDRLYNENRKTRINYFNRWLELVGGKTLAEINIDDIALNLCKYGKKVKKESSHRKYVEYFKELASAYAADNKCANPIANTKWSTYLKISGLAYNHDNNEDKGDSRTAIEEPVFRKITESLEGLINEYPDKTSPYALLFMAYTGMRPSDITSLKWTHIRIEDPSYLHIRKVLQKTSKKNPSSSIIPISPQATEILDRVKSLSGGDYVFSETTNVKNTAGLTTVWWKKVRADTGILFPPYQLRHNMAHRILRAGGTIADVASTLSNTVEICVTSYLNNDTRHAAQILRNMQL